MLVQCRATATAVSDCKQLIMVMQAVHVLVIDYNGFCLQAAAAAAAAAELS